MQRKRCELWIADTWHLNNRNLVQCNCDYLKAEKTSSWSVCDNERLVALTSQSTTITANYAIACRANAKKYRKQKKGDSGAENIDRRGICASVTNMSCGIEFSRIEIPHYVLRTDATVQRQENRRPRGSLSLAFVHHFTHWRSSSLIASRVCIAR